jgi:mono/diheme cytochrome c family protein
MHRIATTLLSSLVAVTVANTAALADVANGEKLARRWCASCHVVATDQRQGNTQAAPFSEMAKIPGLNAEKIALFLLAPHPPMPDMSMSRSEAADLAVYIARQGK